MPLAPHAFLYDLYSKVKEMYGHPLREAFQLWTGYWKSLDQRVARRVDKIVVNSKNVKERVRKYYGRGATVVNPPVDTEKFYFEEFGDFFLSVNRLTPFKRVDVQLDAFEELDETLVLVGGTEKMGSYEEEISKRIKRMENVRWRRDISDRELAELYSSVQGDHSRRRWTRISGTVSVESAAAGKPCLAVNEAGSKKQSNTTRRES